jgi:two-component sensor histidine kinase
VGIDAKEREASDKLQTLIVEELHHRIKNTLAIVSVITSQSLRTAATMDLGRKAIEARLGALGRAHDLLMPVLATGEPNPTIDRETCDHSRWQRSARTRAMPVTRSRQVR